MKYAQLVIGPAGSGKTTYCAQMHKYMTTLKRHPHVVNLDPAADTLAYEPSIDIRELIDLDEVMQRFDLGPNGGLVYCMEYLLENIDWFEQEVEDFSDDYLIIDCPGQIELYTHIPVMRVVAQTLRRWGYNLTVVQLLDAQFLGTASKFTSGALLSLSCMTHLETSHINVLSKMDLVEAREEGARRRLESYLNTEPAVLSEMLNEDTSERFKQLNRSFSSVLDEFNLVSFQPLNWNDEATVEALTFQLDTAMQYGEDEEPRDPETHREDDDDGGDGGVDVYGDELGGLSYGGGGGSGVDGEVRALEQKMTEMMEEQDRDNDQ